MVSMGPFYVPWTGKTRRKVRPETGAFGVDYSNLSATGRRTAIQDIGLEEGSGGRWTTLDTMQGTLGLPVTHASDRAGRSSAGQGDE